MVASMSARGSSCSETRDHQRCRGNQEWPLGGAAIPVCGYLVPVGRMSGVVAAAVVAGIIGIEVHGVAIVLFIVGGLVVRRLVEQAGPRIAIAATAAIALADIVDACIARQRAIGLIAPRAGSAISHRSSVAEGLLVTWHHRANAIEQ